jgi:hypothetical protein
VIVQNRFLRSGLRAYTYAARFFFRIDSSEQCSAEIVILLPMSGSHGLLHSAQQETLYILPV